MRRLIKLLLIYLAGCPGIIAFGGDFRNYDELRAELFRKRTTFRGYYKRDRFFVFGSKISSLAQMHEIDGWRLGGGLQTRRDNTRFNGEGLTYRSETLVVDGAYGFDRGAIGVVAANVDGDYEHPAMRTYEQLDLNYFMPRAAFFIDKNHTVSIGVESGNLTSIFEDVTYYKEGQYYLMRTSVGAAFHTPKMEMGLAYQSEIGDEINVDSGRSNQLSIAKTRNDARYIYAPAMLSTYVRGNLTDALSLHGRLGYSFYDSSAPGALKIFADGKDRISAKLAATFWTITRSRISLAAEYRGGATARDGVEELGVGNRIANLYGAALAGIYSIDKLTYVGLVARYLRGERDQTAEGQRYSSRESQRTFSLSLGAKI